MAAITSWENPNMITSDIIKRLKENYPQVEISVRHHPPGFYGVEIVARTNIWQQMQLIPAVELEAMSALAIYKMIERKVIEPLLVNANITLTHDKPKAPTIKDESWTDEWIRKNDALGKV